MAEFLKSSLAILVFTILMNLSVVLGTLMFHEAGHFVTGVESGCQDIRVVVLSSDQGTYTEMRCPQKENLLLPAAGALLLTTPFALAFFLLRDFPERNLAWISLGFNLSISLIDMPGAVLQWGSLIGGLSLVILGEVLFVDRLLSTLLWPKADALGLGR